MVIHNNQIKFILEHISMLPLFGTLSLSDNDVLWLQNIKRGSYDNIMSYVDEAANMMKTDNRGHSQSYNCVVYTMLIVERLNRHWCTEIESKFNQSISNEIIDRIGYPPDDLIDAIRSHLQALYYNGK